MDSLVIAVRLTGSLGDGFGVSWVFLGMLIVGIAPNLGFFFVIFSVRTIK